MTYGIRAGDKLLAIFHFSNAKKPRLCIKDDKKGTIVQYAICNDDKVANELIDAIAEMLNIPKKEIKND